MIALLSTFAIDGVQSRRITVEADVRSRGLPAFTLVGLADKAVREARDRVKGALENSGFQFPSGRVTVNLAPAYLRKGGEAFDLPVAIAVLAAEGKVPREAVETSAFAGELGLGGDLRPVRGVLAMAEGAASHRIERFFLPRSRAAEAAVVPGIEVVGAETLQEVVDVLRGNAEPAPIPETVWLGDDLPDEPDLADVRGHNGLIAAIEVAAAGAHNLFLHGPPGTGKTMLARRIPGILPPLSHQEAVDVTRIHSIAGLHTTGALVSRRPFRAPHHLISPPGLVGGGSTPQPGEVTLAHHGVLFLDELSEFSRPTLEALRQPLEDGQVVVVRAQRVLTFPSRCMLVAASNPCPCGLVAERCRCGAADLRRHERRLSGPLMDRIDVTVHVSRPGSEALRTQEAPPSSVVRERVIAARERQEQRFAGTGILTNSQMTPAMARDLARVTPSARRRLFEAHDARGLSARGNHRVLRLARTIADLAGSDVVGPEHIDMAVVLRADATPEALAA